VGAISSVEKRTEVRRSHAAGAWVAPLSTAGAPMPPKKTARFPRAARLLRHADFERVYKQGKRHFSASMTVFYLPRAQEEPSTRGMRVGFTVGRGLGGAVQRNRMKRRLREAVRLSRHDLNVPVDVVINPKKTLLVVDFAAVVNEVGRAFVTISEKLAVKPGRTPPAAREVIRKSEG
jgi:ribonuclease P protein component